MCLSYPSDPTATIPLPPKTIPVQQQHTPKPKCVYGYVGTSFDDAIKPILLLYLVGSCMGTLFFAVLNQDGSRFFMLSTCGHLATEVITWTHMLFPPATTRENHEWMWRIRTLYLLGVATLCWAPSQSVVTAAYMIMSGVSDFLAFWMGLLFVAKRTHFGARRLGMAFLVHGASFHLAAFEFFHGNKLWGDTNLKGFSWMVLIISSTAAFLTVPSLFKEPLDLRSQTPSRQERKFLVCGVFASFLTIPPWGAGGPSQALQVLPQLLERPLFLPTETNVMFLYKTCAPTVALVLSLYVLTAYIDAGLPILPMTNNTTTTTISSSSKGRSFQNEKKCPYQ